MLEYFHPKLFLSSLKGFLPELKFSRILTEPVNLRSRHRGRRPRADVPKRLLSVSNVTSSSLSQSFFINGGLLSNMDSIVAMQNLQSAIPGIPISRIMAAGCPHSFSAAAQPREAGAPAVNSKNSLNMLPMMLQGIPHGAAVPQHAIFSIGAMMPHSSSSSSSPAGRASAQTSGSTSVGTDASFTRAADVSSHHSEGEGDSEVKESSDSVGEAEEAAAAATSASRVHLSTAHLGAGSHVAFNPFLIPGMSHGLLYPHMFLPHGGIMALPAMPPGAVEAPHGNPKRRKNRGQEEWERKEEKAASVDEKESTVKGAASSSLSSSSTPPPKPEELHGQQAERRDCLSGANAEEVEQRQEDTAEKVEQDSEGQEDT